MSFLTFNGGHNRIQSKIIFTYWCSRDKNRTRSVEMQDEIASRHAILNNTKKQPSSLFFSLFKSSRKIDTFEKIKTSCVLVCSKQTFLFNAYPHQVSNHYTYRHHLHPLILILIWSHILVFFSMWPRLGLNGEFGVICRRLYLSASFILYLSS